MGLRVMFVAVGLGGQIVLSSFFWLRALLVFGQFVLFGLEVLGESVFKEFEGGIGSGWVFELVGVFLEALELVEAFVEQVSVGEDL